MSDLKLYAYRDPDTGEVCWWDNTRDEPSGDYVRDPRFDQTFAPPPQPLLVWIAVEKGKIQWHSLDRKSMEDDIAAFHIEDRNSPINDRGTALSFYQIRQFETDAKHYAEWE